MARPFDISEAFALVERKDTSLVTVLRNLLAINTTNPPGLGYERMVDFLDSRLRQLGFRNQRVTVPEHQWGSLPLPLDGPRVNLVSTRQYGHGLEDATITAHMDTVPAEGAWRFDPFQGTIEFGRMYGRGTADSKGAIAALLVAFEVLGQLRLEAKYNVTLCFTTDEEIGGYPGSLELARRGFFKGHVLCLEGSQEPEELLAGAGMTDVHITVRGQSCHTCVNFLGVNAIEEMVPILNELMTLKREVEAREIDIPAPTYDGLRSGRMAPTFSLSVLQGGEKSNVVPGDCTLIVNRRFTPDETQQSAADEILAAVERGRAKSRALEVETRVLPGFPAFRVNLDNPHAARLREATKIVCGYRDEDFRRWASTNSSSMGFVQQVTGKDQFYFLGASRSDSHVHGVDECCRLSDLHNLTKQLVYYLTA